MAGRRPQKPVSRRSVSPPDVDDPNVSRALDALAAAVQAVESRPSYQFIDDVDLSVGMNAVTHSLGRPARVLVVTPSVADASFAYALVRTNNEAHRQVLVEIVGVAQPKASLFLM